MSKNRFFSSENGRLVVWRVVRIYEKKKEMKREKEGGGIWNGYIRDKYKREKERTEEGVREK